LVRAIVKVDRNGVGVESGLSGGEVGGLWFVVVDGKKMMWKTGDGALYTC
jgi:hypothetical protein